MYVRAAPGAGTTRETHHCGRALKAWLFLIACFAVGAAHADLVDKLNMLRTRGCPNASTSLGKLQASKDLDVVAHEWSRGGRLRDALKRTNYRTFNSASMRVEGTRDDDRIAQTLRASYCETITNRDFTDIGVYRSGTNAWMVLAVPFKTPSASEAPAVAKRVLELVNAARSKPRRCGSKLFSAAPPLSLSAMLTQAALKHAQDMSAHSLFEHHGSDGSMPPERVSRTGYEWTAVAENIAAGANTADQVVEGWINSPDHCINIMGAVYQEMGIAYAVDLKSEAGIYWVQDFARPR